MLKIIKTLGQNEAHRHGGASIRMIKICKLSIDKLLSILLQKKLPRLFLFPIVYIKGQSAVGDAFPEFIQGLL